MCAAISDSRSAAMRAGRRSDIRRDRKTLYQSTQRQLVTIGAESANDGQRGIGQRRAPPLRLAGVDVRQMHLDEWDLHSRQRIVNCQAGVAVGAGVDERAIDAPTQCLHRIHDLAFSIVLRERELDAQLSRDAQEMLLDVGQRFGPVKGRLARAEEIEVRSIDDGDSHSPVSPSSQARNFATSSSDSWVCGSRGFTLGVGIGGVGGVRDVVVPWVPLNAPARRDAARLSAGFTVAPANTASSDAPGAAVASGGGGGSDGALFAPRAAFAAVPPARGGRRRPRVAKNSLIDGCLAAMPSGSASGSSRAGDSIDSRSLNGCEGGESIGDRSKPGDSSDSGARPGLGDSMDGARGAAGGGDGRSTGDGSRRASANSGWAARSAASISAILSFNP